MTALIVSKTMDQSQTTNKSQSVDKNQSKDKNQTPASEEKKVVENTKNETEKTEKKKEPVVVKENNSKQEAILNKEKVEEAPKNGWQKEHGKWLFYENNQPIKNWKKLRVSGISLIKMESWLAIGLLMTMLFILVEQW